MAAHAATAARLNRLGLRCKAAGRYDEGRAQYELALGLLAGQPAPDLDAVATLYHNLGGIEHARGDYVAAESFARRGVEIRAGLSGADPGDLAADWAALAAILDGQERYDEAEALYQEALRVFQRSAPGVRAWDVAVALGNLGTQYAQQGRLDQAVDLLLQAAELKREFLGSGHPDVAVTLNNLALTLRRRGEFTRATSLYEEAVCLLERSLGADHPQTITCRANAARCAEAAAGLAAHQPKALLAQAERAGGGAD